MSKDIEELFLDEYKGQISEQKEIDECFETIFSASAGATGEANSKYCNVKVTASSTASAEGSTLE